jgi:hypothetical protein
VFPVYGRRAVRQVVIREASVGCYFAIFDARLGFAGINESFTRQLRALQSSATDLIRQ